MGRDEFLARGISAISFEHHRKEEQQRQVTAANVLYWTYDKGLKDFSKMAYSTYETYADEYFSRYGNHLHIIESGLSGLTVKDIANVATKFKKKSGRPVVVFVDYMQIIKVDPDDRTQSIVRQNGCGCYNLENTCLSDWDACCYDFEYRKNLLQR